MIDVPIDSTDAAERRADASCEDAPPVWLRGLTVRCLDARPPQANRLGWTEAKVLEARQIAAAAGVPERDLDDVLVALASDPDVEYPGSIKRPPARHRARDTARRNRARTEAGPGWCPDCSPAHRLDRPCIATSTAA